MDTRLLIHTNAAALAGDRPCAKTSNVGADARQAVARRMARALAERDAG